MSLQNSALLRALMKDVTIEKEPSLLFAFSNQVLEKEFCDILLDLLAAEPPSKASINILNDEGMSPFFMFVKGLMG